MLSHCALCSLQPLCRSFFPSPSPSVFHYSGYFPSVSLAAFSFLLCYLLSHSAVLFRLSNSALCSLQPLCRSFFSFPSPSVFHYSVYFPSVFLAVFSFPSVLFSPFHLLFYDFSFSITHFPVICILLSISFPLTIF